MFEVGCGQHHKAVKPSLCVCVKKLHKVCLVADRLGGEFLRVVSSGSHMYLLCSGGDSHIQRRVKEYKHSNCSEVHG